MNEDTIIFIFFIAISYLNILHSSLEKKNAADFFFLQVTKAIGQKYIGITWKK